jgi:hypothetical protein
MSLTEEPTFVLKASDPFAAKCVRDWAARAMMAGYERDIIMGAIKVAEEMEKWTRDT